MVQGVPLKCAIESNCQKIVEYLINKGADVNYIRNTPYDVLTPIQLTIIQLFNLLLSKGANCNILSAYGNLALFYALKEDSIDYIIKYLMKLMIMIKYI
jgi:ankyrin repeat protein